MAQYRRVAGPRGHISRKLPPAHNAATAAERMEQELNNPFEARLAVTLDHRPL
jgi:hypothetical protein